MQTKNHKSQIGNYETKIDKGSRTHVYPKLKELIKKNNIDTVLIFINFQNDHLKVFLSERDFKRFETDIASLIEDKQKQYILSKSLGIRTFSCSCDDRQRIVIPKKVLEQVGIKNNILWFGCSFYSEIWDAEEGKKRMEFLNSQAIESLPPGLSL